jgi:hypothetical protein
VPKALLLAGCAECTSSDDLDGGKIVFGQQTPHRLPDFCGFPVTVRIMRIHKNVAAFIVEQHRIFRVAPIRSAQCDFTVDAGGRTDDVTER